MMKRRWIFFVLFIDVFLFIPFISGQINEAQIKLEDDNFLILSENKLHLLKSDFTPLWIWNDEGEIIDSKFINDFDSDGYDEVLVTSKSLVMPSTKILNGKTGEIIKLIPFSKKTYKNVYPTATSHIAIKENKIVVSNFKRIYEINENGNSAEKKLEFSKFIKGVEFIGNNIVVVTSDKIFLYDLNFNEIKSEEVDIQNLEVFFGDTIFVLFGYRTGTNSPIAEIYNSDLSKLSSFSADSNSELFVFGEKIALFDIMSNKLKVYTSSGVIITEIKNVKNVVEQSGKLYYLLSDSKDVMKVESVSNNIQKLFNISIEDSQRIKLIGKNYFVVEEEGEIKLYNKNDFVSSYNLVNTKSSLNIDGTDFLISSYYPFNYFYKEFSGKIDLNDIKGKNIVSIEEVGDLDNDGTKEILIGFSNEQSFSKNVVVEIFVLLNIKTESIKKISFIPTGEELIKIFKKLENDIDSIDKLKNSKEKNIKNLESEINSLDPIKNASEIADLQSKIADLQSKINDLDNDLLRSKNELHKYENENLKYSNVIKSYAVFDNSKKLFIIILNDDKYIIDLLDLGKETFSYDHVFNSLINVGDINSDNRDDIMFIGNEFIGVFSGKDYRKLWEKDISTYGINYIKDVSYSFGSNYVLITSELESEETRLGRINIDDGVYNKLTNARRLEFLKKMDEKLIYSLDESIFIFSSNGETVQLDDVKIDIYNRVSESVDDFFEIAFYDCDKDGNEDILYVPDFQENERYSKSNIKNYFSSSNLNVKRLVCIDKNSKRELMDAKFYGAINYGFQSSAIKMKVINENLFVEMDNFYYVLDLNNFEIISKLLIRPYDSGNALMDTNGEVINILTKNIISSPNDGVLIDGDFKLNFDFNNIFVINVDNNFYTSTLKNNEIIKLGKGAHDIEVSYYDLQSKQYIIDSVNIEIKRPKSILPYFAILLTIFIIILGGFKWKIMKR